MNDNNRLPILEKTRILFREIVKSAGLMETEITVLAKPLTPEEAIGTPGRRDYPIIIGKERILEAAFLGAKGHAFTDSAREFTGNLADVLGLEFLSNQNRAIYIATLNAVLRHLGQVKGTVHCKDEEPEECGSLIASHILENHGECVVGIIGLNPAIAENLIKVFGVEKVLISDLCADNIGKERLGVEVWDGAGRTLDLVEKADVILMTGTTLQNDTFDSIWTAIQARGKKGLIFGVTGAGVCALTGIERICPCGHDS
jgi:hypothetical protein